MKILVTGNNGYIGTVLTEILYNQSFDVVGLDNNYFEQCNLTKVNNLSNQIIKDIRDVNIKDVVQKVHDADIEIIANYLFGLPGDSIETMQKTLNLRKFRQDQSLYR